MRARKTELVVCVNKGEALRAETLRHSSIMTSLSGERETVLRRAVPVTLAVGGKRWT
jgi:hypothetical protein